MGLVLTLRCRGLNRLSAEGWTIKAPQIRRGMGAADWTGFGLDSGWLWDFWDSVFGVVGLELQVVKFEFWGLVLVR